MPTQQPHVKSQHRPTRWYQKMKANDMTIICHLLLLLKITYTKIFGTGVW